ncbi:MAG: DUF4783 domain-containing protein [Hyphomicrobiales bacterium]
MNKNRTNYRTLFSSIILVFIAITANAQNQEDVINAINKSIIKGDAEGVATYFDTNIDLRLPKIDGSYSSKQAVVILGDFFKSTPSPKFNIQHRGSSNDGSYYAIGKYTSNDIKYRTYFLLKKKNGRYLIQQLQFEKE